MSFSMAESEKSGFHIYYSMPKFHAMDNAKGLMRNPIGLCFLSHIVNCYCMSIFLRVLLSSKQTPR